MGTTSGLRDALLASLRPLPGTRDFHLHVLVSSPQKHATLFPYARPRPRTYAQHVLVLLSEQSGVLNDAPRLFVSAIDAVIYMLPSTSSAILYISKVDSTGQASAPSPTSTLVRAFLTYYADPSTRPIPAEHLWIHIFARAQNQYLFPNSSEFEGKRWLTDVRLCAWWKRQLSEVAQTVQTRSTSIPANSKSTPVAPSIGLFYILPGLNEFEAVHTIQRAAGSFATASSLANAPQWTYGHPYKSSSISLPCSPPKDGNNLGHFIPWFDDDPKSRFLDEIACTTEAEGVRSPERKRRKLVDRPEEDEFKKQEDSTADGKDGFDGSDARESAEDHRPPGELAKVGVDEFWERMSFRQECVSGAITGFFVFALSGSPGVAVHAAATKSNPTANTTLPPSAMGPQPGQVSTNLVKRVLTSLMTGNDFSSTERAARSTETIENAIRGLCDGVVSEPAPSAMVSRSAVADAAAPDSAARRTPEPPDQRGSLALSPPHTPTRPLRNTAADKRALSVEAVANPFPEPVATMETYATHIYGSLKINNPPATSRSDVSASGPGASGEPAKVTVLTVRKKKKA